MSWKQDECSRSFLRIRRSETPGDDQVQASISARSRTKFIAFMVNRVLTKEQIEQRELKDLPWKKYEDFQAAIT